MTSEPAGIKPCTCKTDAEIGLCMTPCTRDMACIGIRVTR